jgi:hypothetical protein
MIRLHTCSAAFTTALCIALLVPAAQSGPRWDSRESASDLFYNGTSSRAKAMPYMRTAATLSKWARPGAARALGKSLTRELLPTGAHLSLVSLKSTSSVLEACGAGQDVVVAPPATSVVGAPPNTANCSSFAGPPANANGQCSVQFKDGTPKNQPNCSSTGNVDTGGNGPCSAGSGSPTNPNNGNNTTFCSATQGVLGAGASTSCTAANSAGAGAAGAQCSAFQGPANAGSFCSVGNTGGNSTCSTGVEAAPGGLGGTCSTLNGGAAGDPPLKATCSVKTGSQGSSCSCTVAGQNCSVGTNNAGDFCSVQADPNNFNQCTTLAGQNGAGVCSVIPPSTAGAKQCSGAVVHTDGTCSSR